MRKTIIDEIEDQIDTLLNKRAEDLATCRKAIEGARAKARENEKAIAMATESMDLDAYEKAIADKAKIETEISMYESRYVQLEKNEYITEFESDRVFESIDNYEKELEKDFQKSIEPHLEKLRDILFDYRAKVNHAEKTLKTWENTIHANYRSKTTVYADTGTNRCPSPIAYRMTPYNGSQEANVLEIFLNHV